MKSKSAFEVDERGYYGNFGGAFIPEMLYPNVEELRLNYRQIMESPDFIEEFERLLIDYVGRPTPLFWHKDFQKNIMPKSISKEKTFVTQGHIRSTILWGRLFWQKLGKHKIVAETGAGQHGVATATMCALMGLECIVYMGEIDMERQAPNVARMKMLGAEVRPAKVAQKL